MTSHLNDITKIKNHKGCSNNICQLCGGEGAIYRPTRIVTKVIDVGERYSPSQGKIIHLQETIEQTIGGIDICPLCQVNSETQYNVEKKA